MARLVLASPVIFSGMASMTFSTTLMSPKRANVLCSMMAVLALTACLRGSSGFRDQKSTERVSVSPPQSEQGFPAKGRSRLPHLQQRLTL